MNAKTLIISMLVANLVFSCLALVLLLEQPKAVSSSKEVCYYWDKPTFQKVVVMTDKREFKNASASLGLYDRIAICPEE